MNKIRLIDHAIHLNSNLKRKFRFKLHKTSGPALHSDFEFSLAPDDSDCYDKEINLSFSDELKNIFLESAYLQTDEELYDGQIVQPFKRGVKRFAKYLDEHQTCISNSILLTIQQYTFHPVDSKPISSELGIDLALKYVFAEELRYPKDTRFEFEEITDR